MLDRALISLELLPLLKVKRTMFVSKPCIIHQFEISIAERALGGTESIVDWGLKLRHMWTGKVVLDRF